MSSFAQEREAVSNQFYREGDADAEPQTHQCPQALVDHAEATLWREWQHGDGSAASSLCEKAARCFW